MADPVPVEGKHAMYCGWICGLAARQGLEVLPVVTEDGRYTDQLMVWLPGVPVRTEIGAEVHRPLVLVVPPPPKNWTLTP